MDKILTYFQSAKKKYDKNIDPCDEIKQTAIECIQKLRVAETDEWNGPSGKKYLIYSSEGNLSRPFLKSQLILTAKEFGEQWDRLIQSANRAEKKFSLSSEEVSKIIYNAVVPFCVCVDIWKPKSRKNPGTFFEIVLGALMSRILSTSVSRTKHIALPPQTVPEASGIQRNDLAASLMDMPEGELALEDESPLLLRAPTEEIVDDEEEGTVEDMQKVSTDIVFDFNGKGIVIPAKITTRERIVQPFAHQRILDGVFGVGRYISLLICVSETQRSEKDQRVNDICVPGTIALFQMHLAKMGGIYYLDPPERYMELGRAGIVPIHSLGVLLTSGLAEIVKRLESTPSGSSKPH